MVRYTCSKNSLLHSKPPQGVFYGPDIRMGSPAHISSSFSSEDEIHTEKEAHAVAFTPGRHSRSPFALSYPHHG
jgi:hypothetical protein